MLKKRFSIMRYGGTTLAVLMAVAFSFSVAHAQTIDTVGAQDTLTVHLQNKAVQDSLVMPTAKFVVMNTVVPGNDSATVFLAWYKSRFRFAKKGPYTVTVSGSKTLTSLKGVVTSDYANIGIGIKNSTSNPDTLNNDTLTISGVYVTPDSTVANSDGSTFDEVQYSIDSSGTSFPSTNFGPMFKLLPGPIYKVSMDTQPDSTVQAGNSITAAVKFTDMFGNVSDDSTTAVSVSAVLNGTTTPGNGTLGGTSVIAKTLTLGTATSAVDSYKWTALTYTKAENIQLVFTAPGGKVTSNEIDVTPGTPANLAVTVPSSEAFTVGGSPLGNWVATVTDKYSNPVDSGSGYVHVTEKTPHGGKVQGGVSGTTATFKGDSTGITVTGGKTGTIGFLPSNYYTGKDTLVFSLTVGGTTEATFVDPGITVTAGPPAGVIVDYAGTANGTSVKGDSVAAGTQIYARAFLRDTYGNPVSATSASEISFTMKSGKGAAIGTPALTNAISVSEYPNSNKTAVGVAVPYTMSDTVKANSDQITATAGSYSASETIQNRSNVPAKLKMAYNADSSVVVSNFKNTLSVTDTVWDKYGNICTTPGKGSFGPDMSQYALYYATNGSAGFVRAKDTTSADTLYPNASGQVTAQLSSSKMAGLDTVMAVAAANSALSTSLPVWVVPAAVSKIVLTPSADTTAIAGAPMTFTVQTEDQYGNHVDWGFTGGKTISEYETAWYDSVGGKPDASKIDSAITDSLNAMVFDTVSTGHNRGGVVDSSSLTTTGKYALANVGGTLNATFKFTPYVDGADTQQVFVSLGGMTDTSVVRSALPGQLSSFAVTIKPVNSSDTLGGMPAGDSIEVTVIPKDVTGNILYTYKPTNLTLSVTGTSVSPYTKKDSTFYFIYHNENGDTVVSNGDVKDTIGTGGQFTFYLRKFTAEDVAQRIKVTAGSVSDSSAKTFTYVPLNPKNGFGHWLVTVNTDTVQKGSPTISFTVTPRDIYDNVNTKDTTLVDITTNLSTGTYTFGGNPQVIIGPTMITGTLTGGASSIAMKVTVYNTANTHIFGTGQQSILDAIEGNTNLPKKFALEQNYPNPFNPTTTIKYDVPKASNVTIVIYDILGDKVSTLVSRDNVAPGQYTAVWNGRNSAGQQVSSGVYFYRMQAGNFVSIKKMLLLK